MFRDRLLFGRAAPLPLPLLREFLRPETFDLLRQFGPAEFLFVEFQLFAGLRFEVPLTPDFLLGKGQTVRGVLDRNGVLGGVVDRVEHGAFIGKAHFGLGGVHVDIHHFEGQRDVQYTGRELADHDGVLVGPVQGSRRRRTLDEAAVQEEELHGAVRAARGGLRDEAFDRDTVQLIGGLEQRVREVLAEDRVDGGLEVPVAGRHQDLLVVTDEPDGDLGVGQRDAVDDAGHTVALRDVLL